MSSFSVTDLLHSMTMIGKQGENAFSPASKLSQESSTDKSNPVYGLKRDVIRLIGNLVYKHRANQDKVDTRNISSQDSCMPSRRTSGTSFLSSLLSVVIPLKFNKTNRRIVIFAADSRDGRRASYHGEHINRRKKSMYPSTRAKNRASVLQLRQMRPSCGLGTQGKRGGGCTRCPCNVARCRNTHREIL